MALSFQTEYRLGRRGRVCRSYTGAQAMGAILFELTFGLLFELTCLITRQTLLLVVLTLSILLYALKAGFHLLFASFVAAARVLAFPLYLLRGGSGHSDHDADCSRHRKVSTKPDFAFGRDL